MKNIIILIILILFTVPSLAEEEIVTIKRVINGNSLTLTNGERVTLIGLEVPDNRVNDRSKKMSFDTGFDLDFIMKKGEEAKTFVEKIALNQKVTLEYDIIKKTASGRTLAYVWVEVGEDGNILLLDDALEWELRKKDNGKYGQFIFLNGALVKAGFAKPRVTIPNTKYDELFEEFYKEAIENKRGLWKLFILLY